MTQNRLATAVAILLSGVWHGGAFAVPPSATSIMPEDPEARKFQEEWGFADAVVTGDLIFLSGVVVGPRAGDADLILAYERGFQRIAAILARAGSSWADVVDITSYHTDLTTQMQPIVTVKKRYVKAPFPAWTAIGVSRLIPNNGVTEIKVIARKSGNRQ